MRALGVDHLRSPVPEKMRGNGIYGPCGTNGLGAEQGHFQLSQEVEQSSDGEVGRSGTASGF